MRGQHHQAEDVVQKHKRSFRSLQQMTGLHLNDLWSLHGSMSGLRHRQRALLQPRGGKAILVHLGPVKAVLLADRCMFFDIKSGHSASLAEGLRPLATLGTQGDEKAQFCCDLPIANVRICDDRYGWDDDDELYNRPFELNCLERILSIIAKRLGRRVETFLPAVDKLVHEALINTEAPEAVLAELVMVSRALTKLKQAAANSTQCLDEILASEEEMLSMLLTANSQLEEGQTLPKHYHDTVETILESYLFVFKSVHDQIYIMLKQIETTQVAAQLMLEHKRTRMITLNVHLSIGTLSLGLIGCVGALLGMNVPLPACLAQSSLAFPVVSAVAFWSAMLLHAVTASWAMRNPAAVKMQKVRKAREFLTQLPGLTDSLLWRLDSSNNPAGVPIRLSFESFQDVVAAETKAASIPKGELREIFDAFDQDANGWLEREDMAELLCVVLTGPDELGATEAT